MSLFLNRLVVANVVANYMTHFELCFEIGLSRHLNSFLLVVCLQLKYKVPQQSVVTGSRVMAFSTMTGVAEKFVAFCVT